MTLILLEQLPADASPELVAAIERALNPAALSRDEILDAHLPGRALEALTDPLRIRVTAQAILWGVNAAGDDEARLRASFWLLPAYREGRTPARCVELAELTLRGYLETRPPERIHP